MARLCIPGIPLVKAAAVTARTKTQPIRSRLPVSPPATGVRSLVELRKGSRLPVRSVSVSVVSPSPTPSPSLRSSSQLEGRRAARQARSRPWAQPRSANVTSVMTRRSNLPTADPKPAFKRKIKIQATHTARPPKSVSRVDKVRAKTSVKGDGEAKSVVKPATSVKGDGEAKSVTKPATSVKGDGKAKSVIKPATSVKGDGKAKTLKPATSVKGEGKAKSVIKPATSVKGDGKAKSVIKPATSVKGDGKAKTLKPATSVKGEDKAKSVIKRVRFGETTVVPVSCWIVRKEHVYPGMPSFMGHLQGWSVTALKEPDEDGEEEKYVTYWGSDDYIMLTSNHAEGPCDREGCAWNSLARIQAKRPWWPPEMVFKAWHMTREMTRRRGGFAL